jgi:hypothetical protein
VTVADPPLAVIVLTTVTSQIRPRPPVLSTPLLHVVVGAIVVAADAGEVVMTDPAASSAKATRPRKRSVSGRRLETAARRRALWPATRRLSVRTVS